jgi:uncharacterized protein YdeI (YjbR/CyaY-like superfamily)
MVNKALQSGAKAKAGSSVSVVMEPDTSQRTVAVPADFKRSLDANKTAMLAYNRISPEKKREFVDWITSAKKAETRRARIGKAVEMLLKGMVVKR